MIPDKWFPHHRLRWPTRRRCADFGNYQKACIDWMIDWRLILSRWYISSRISYTICSFLLLLYFLLKRACHMFWYYAFSPRFEMNHFYLLPKSLTYHKTWIKLYEEIQCTIIIIYYLLYIIYIYILLYIIIIIIYYIIIKTNHCPRPNWPGHWGFTQPTTFVST